MNEALVPIIVAAAAVIVTALICATALAAWRGWLSLKREQLLGRPNLPGEVEEQDASAMIEFASVRERLRRLEAIANGVEL